MCVFKFGKQDGGLYVIPTLKLAIDVPDWHVIAHFSNGGGAGWHCNSELVGCGRRVVVVLYQRDYTRENPIKEGYKRHVKIKKVTVFWLAWGFCSEVVSM